MGESLKDKFAVAGVSAILSLVVMLVFFWLTGMWESKDAEREILNSKADKIYVDKTNERMYFYIDAQNEKQNIKIETIRTETREDLKEINHKLDRLIEMNMNKK